MNKRVIRILSALLCSLMLFSGFAVYTSAAAFTYKKGANNVSSAYKNSRFYKNLTKIEITGDGVTDLLAVALAQVAYVEGTNQDGFGGTQGGGGNFTEYNYNMGNWGQGYGGKNYSWCASFVSWCLLQSGCSTQSSMGDWCRNHTGDKNYIWREIGCYNWYNQLKRFGYGHADDGKYIPKSGDLIFFESSEHIGIVRYAKDGRVYTIEGNTGAENKVNPDGGGVYCKSYQIGGGSIRGYGSLPLKTNNKAIKVDYSGENPSTGLWIGTVEAYYDEGAQKYKERLPGIKMYSSTSLSGTPTYIPKGTSFEVTKIVSKGCYEVKYEGKVGYINPKEKYQFVYQMTANAEAGEVPEKETVAANKYAINSDIKKVKEHIGSGISKFTIDDTKIKEVDTFELNAGQKLGIEGFAGFSSYIKEFGYYFDGNAESVVWGINPKEPNDDAKKKAGDKAKLFDIDADTSTLANGAHTVTYVAKFLNNKTCDLVTLNFNLSVDGAESSSETGEGGDGCGSAIAAGAVLPVIVLSCAAIIKKKKED